MYTIPEKKVNTMIIIIGILLALLILYGLVRSLVTIYSSPASDIPQEQNVSH
jgi:hypothetical protein